MSSNILEVDVGVILLTFSMLKRERIVRVFEALKQMHFPVR